jgi:hypothetical protein
VSHNLQVSANSHGVVQEANVFVTSIDGKNEDPDIISINAPGNSNFNSGDEA